MPRCLLYYITDRRSLSGDSSVQRESLLAKIDEAARAGVDYIQLREKDLSAHELETLAGGALDRIHQLKSEGLGTRTNLFINSRADVALASGADGVHLPANDLNPREVRSLWERCRTKRHVTPTISVSCHTPEEVSRAELDGADFAIFAPVFEKKDAPETKPAGLDALRRACQHRIPVVALGGVTLENVGACLDAGAVGIAGIRLFQEHNIVEIVSRLRS
jgi:thiamine-phosphate pyrophosphorylase